MKTVNRLSVGKGFSVDDVRIKVDREAWLPRETSLVHQLVFVRTGSFQLRVREWEVAADPLLAYVSRPGDEQQIAHRVGVIDTCTSVTLSGELLGGLSLGRSTPTRPIATSGRIDLSHRELYHRARAHADQFEMSERVARLAQEMLVQPVPLTPQAHRPAATRRRQLAQVARELLAQDPVSLKLEDLAQQLNSSPHHLSRVFSREIGMSLTRFRNTMRVRRALDRIEQGEHNLAGLAADLGFSDHAHLTRMVREQVGHSPSGVRRLFDTARSPQHRPPESPEKSA